MQTATLEEVQARLPQIVDLLKPGTEIVITRECKPVAKLVHETRPIRQPRKPGSAKGLLVVLKEDDEHLQDFAEYME
jgi:antitoxin (DNA-binding transcriptional repressor) of toxin-antitoxin stability system